jgi:pimeloyl-ACP methyl ester carboxylesterase
MPQLVDNDRLRIAFTPGTTGTLVVSFTGVGLGMGGIQREEFGRSLGSGDHAVAYVIDKTRSWYNQTSEEIVGVLSPVCRDFANVVTLGNSMGGFGALYFSGILPNIRHAIAFTPQYSVSPDSPETRWQEWRAAVTDWRIPHALVTLSDAAPCLVVFGTGDPGDVWHRRKISTHFAPPHELITIPNGGHNPAAHLSAKGLLAPFIQAAIAGDSTLHLLQCLR